MKQSAGFHVLANVATGIAAGLLIFAWLTVGRLRRTGMQPAA